LSKATLLVKVAGSLLSLRGIKATGASGLTAALGAGEAGGGDTGRVADFGRALTVVLRIDALDRAVLADSGMFVVGSLFLGMSALTIPLDLSWTGAEAALLGAFALSSSFSRFAIGSGSYVAAAGDGDVRVVVGCVES
jgi:hypothetical protein